MKKIYFFLLLIITIGMVLLYVQSCKRDVNKYDDYVYVKDDKFVGIDEANEIASNVNKSDIVLSSVEKNSLKSAKYVGKRQIHDSLTISDKQKMPYFYVFNYSLGGFTIISADRRLMPILAYVDSSSLRLDSLPSGLILWLEAYAHLIQNLRKTNAKQSTIVAQVYSSMTCLPTEQKAATSNCPPPTVTYSHTVGPLTKTTWYQDCAYNTYCPILSGGPCGHAWTGCSTTAIAQVMYYWKYPKTYNWNAMSLTYGNDAVAKLMGDIFPLVITPTIIGGILISKNYDNGGSGCPNDYNITHAFLNNFHYSSASLEGYVNGITENGGYNYEDVVTNLNLNEPVILGAYDNYVNILGLYSYPSGDGHTWVCDGYSSVQYSNGYGFLMFDMNWGWGGAYNGWYGYDGWSSANGNYSFFPDMIFNIHP